VTGRSLPSRRETGALAPTDKTARAADEALGLPGSLGSLREILLNLGGGQWQPNVAEMEKRETLISLWDPCYLPGLLQTESYMLHAVIWEPAFRVPVGGPKVIYGQLMELAEATRANRRVRLQVLPLEYGVNAGMGGAFLVANFPHERPAAVLDNLLTGHLTEKRADVDRLSLLFSTLASDAMNPQASADMIERWAGEWRT
jgi:uncharacterized protein DUF5753